MAVRIRLKRIGKKKRPYYRVVVADSRFPRDGRFIEELGVYDPLVTPVVFNVDLERVKYWLGNGAQPTDTVKALLKKYSENEQKEQIDSEVSRIEAEDANMAEEQSQPNEVITVEANAEQEA
jgi:small subunit ribosomal protein S16